MDDIKTFILFSALFKYNGSGLHKCVDTIKDMFCIKPGYAIYSDYDVKNVIEAAIKNNDIDIEKLCESLNL